MFHASMFLLCRTQPARSTLFPYTTLFRSEIAFGAMERLAAQLFGPHEPPKGDGHQGDQQFFGAMIEIPECLRRTRGRSEEHTSELQSRVDLVCRLLLEKKKTRLQYSRSKH